MEWGLLFGIHAEESELAREGLTPDEIAEVIARRGEPEPGEGGTLLDTLLGEEAAADRQFRRLEREFREGAEEEDDEP